MSIIDSIVKNILESTTDENRDMTNMTSTVEEYGDANSGVYEKKVTQQGNGFKSVTRVTVASKDGPAG